MVEGSKRVCFGSIRGHGFKSRVTRNIFQGLIVLADYTFLIYTRANQKIPGLSLC